VQVEVEEGVSLNLHAQRECHTAPCLRCLAGCVCTVSQGAQLTAAGCTLVALCTPVLLHCRGRREHRWRGNQARYTWVSSVSGCIAGRLGLGVLGLSF
jgi:hypothetical protein